MIISLFWSQLEKKLFKIKIGPYQWGYLRHTIYRQLNHPFENYQLPQRVLASLTNQINYGEICKISVIIPTRNRLDALKKYALTILPQVNFDPKKYEVIIVDNSFNDDNFNYLKRCKWPDNYQIFRSAKPGISRAYNLGLKVATGDIITFLEDDCSVDPDWLNRICHYHQDNQYLFGEGLIYDEVKKTILNQRNNPERERNFLDGNMSYRRDIFKFVTFNENIIYGDEGYDLLSQIFVFWPKAAYFYDDVPIKHYRQLSIYRDAGQTEHNRQGKKMLGRMHGLWQADKHCLKRNLNIGSSFFALRFFFKEIFFIPIELFLVYGHLIWLIKSKIKIYRQLLKIKKLSFLKNV